MTLITESNIEDLRDIGWRQLNINDKIDKIIWVVTSANHSNTRRNPLPAHRREAMIEDFARHLNAESYVFHIDDVWITDKFAEYIIKKIEVDSLWEIVLTPENTVVWCSTPWVIDMYEKVWFQVLPFELEDKKSQKFKTDLPWDLVENIIATNKAGKDWRTEQWFLTQVSRASKKIYTKYSYWDLLIDLFEDPLLGNDGDITETRDYNTYVRAFDDWAKRKYELIKNIAKPWRIVDIGCCTWALIWELTHDQKFRESDFYGIEVARALFTECLHRKEKWYFANDNVFFYQRNVAKWKIFQDNTIDTFTTFSLTHEIESYQWRETLLTFIWLIYDQLKYGWKWINVDVVWPANWDDEIYLQLNMLDWRNDDWEMRFEWEERKNLKEYLDWLSTYARFLRFARDFRHTEWETLIYSIEKIWEESYIKTSLTSASEFLSKKDYTDNWDSEMHEKFSYFSLIEWQEALEKFGFKITNESSDYSNPWIIENRFEWKAKIFKKIWEDLVLQDYPVTNMVLVAEK
jgi:trans-aconitate methyltransferase